MLLSLPTNYTELNNKVIKPVMLELPAKMSSDSVTLQMMVTAKQESGLNARWQTGNGIARGLWQMEQPTVNLVMINKNSAGYLRTFIEQKLKMPMYSTSIIYDALDKDDFMACAMARLLYWDDPNPMPKVGDLNGAWQYYLRIWRPGAPDFTRWQSAYAEAMRYFKPGSATA